MFILISDNFMSVQVLEKYRYSEINKFKISKDISVPK